MNGIAYLTDNTVPFFRYLVSDGKIYHKMMKLILKECFTFPDKLL